MDQKKFWQFFSKLAGMITVSHVAKEHVGVAASVFVEPGAPLLDVVDLLEGNAAVGVRGTGLTLARRQLMNHQLKVFFYLLVIQVEYQLYKALKLGGFDSGKLKELSFNELVKSFLELDAFGKQGVYERRSELKTDLKAIGAFRNVLMHTNRKLELEAEYDMVLHRKRQLFKCLKALDEVVASESVSKGELML